MVDGATARSKELGWKLDVQAPASRRRLPGLRHHRASNCSRRASRPSRINPIGTDSAVTAVKAANDKGIPILAHNFITPFSEGKVDFLHRLRPVGRRREAGPDHLRADRQEVQHHRRQDQRQGLHPAGHRLDLLAPPHRRLQGRPDQVLPQRQGRRRADRRVAAHQGLRGRHHRLAEDPDIDVFYGNSDEMAIGAALAGEQLGKTINKDFFAVGIDGNQPTLDLLEAGQVLAPPSASIRSAWASPSSTR